MNNNPYDNEFSNGSASGNEYNPYVNEKTQNQNIFLSQTEDNDAFYSSENLDFDAPEVAPAENPVADTTPVQAEYVYPYTQPIAEEVPKTPVVPASQRQEKMQSYEWYGRTPAVSAEEPKKQRIEYKPKPENKVPIAVILIICMVVSIVFGSGAAVVTNYFLGSNGTSSTVVVDNKKEEDKTEDPLNATPQTEELLTTEIVEKYADSVVEIVTETIQTGVFSQQYIESGAGSGVIIDAEGNNLYETGKAAYLATK